MPKIGYLLAKSAFVNFKKRVDYSEYGGAPLLGLNGTGLVCHGRSNAKAIKNAIFVAAELVDKKMNNHILDFFSKIEMPTDTSPDQHTTSKKTCAGAA